VSQPVSVSPVFGETARTPKPAQFRLQPANRKKIAKRPLLAPSPWMLKKLSTRFKLKFRLLNFGRL